MNKGEDLEKLGILADNQEWMTEELMEESKPSIAAV